MYTMTTRFCNIQQSAISFLKVKADMFSWLPVGNIEVV